MNKTLSILVILFICNTLAASDECPISLQEVLLSEAKEIFYQPNIVTQTFQSVDDETPRVRRLHLPSGSTTSSFYEYYKREGDSGIMIFHIERANGNYRALITDLGLTEVLFCSLDRQNVDVQWIGSLPKVNVDFICNTDFNLFADNGSLQYFDNRFEVGGGQWRDRRTGMPALCNGKSEFGFTIYESLNKGLTIN